MDWVKYFSAFGGATVCSLVVTLLFNKLLNGSKRKREEREKRSNEATKAIIQDIVSAMLDKVEEKLDAIVSDNEQQKLGLQALLRSELYALYNKWNELGYAPLYAKENFDNCYKRYHGLGVNGVMDNIYVVFMELPTENPKKKKLLVEEA